MARNRSLLVIFIIALIATPQVGSLVLATEVFSDGFETGDFSAWTGTSIDTGCSLYANDTVNVHHGTYGANATTTATASDFAYSYKTISTTDPAFARYEVKFLTLNVPNANDAVQFLTLDNGGYEYAVHATVRNVGGTLFFALLVVETGVQTFVNSDLTPSTGISYTVEIKRDVANDQQELWVNGTSEATGTVVITQNTVRVCAGIRFQTAAAINVLAFDCVVVADTYIGVEGGGENRFFFNFLFKDLDNILVDSRVTWELYNQSQLLDYTEGTATLLSGVYTLKTYYHNLLMNSTSLDTSSYGNTTVTIFMQMKKHESTGVSIFNYSYSVTADNGTAIGIQAAVDQVEAAGGGTVYVPAGTYYWNGENVTIPGGVNVIGVGLAGSDGYPDFTPYTAETILHNNKDPPGDTMFRLRGENGKPIRISGIQFEATPPPEPGYESGVAINVYRVIDYRIDHCSFMNFSGFSVFFGETDTGNGRGVIDHCIIENKYKDDGQYWAWAYGFYVQGKNFYWNDTTAPITDFLGKYDTTPNGYPIMYVEDCKISYTRHAVDAIQGGWIVSRYNYIDHPHPENFGQLNIHGSEGGSWASGRGFEFYNNTVVGNVTDPLRAQQTWLRGGGGTVFDNTFVNVATYPTGQAIALVNETCPAEPDEVLHNVWIWDNSIDGGTLLDPGDFVEDVDYFLREPTLAQDGFTYDSYTYSHPLTKEDAYISFNKTITDITIHDETDELLNFTVTGPNDAQIIIDVPRNCTYGYLQKNGVNQTYGDNWLFFDSPNPHIVVNASTLSTWTLYFPAEDGGSPPNKWQFTFEHRDRDNNVVDSQITQSLWNGTQELTYTEGQYTLLDGTYTLKTYYKTHQINETSLPTATYGNSTIAITLQMKEQSWGYLAFNGTLTSLTIDLQTSLKLRWTPTGSGPYKQIIDVLEKPAYVSKDGVNQTEGSVWTYGGGLVVIESGLSVWELGYPIDLDDPINTQLESMKRTLYAALGLAGVSIIVSIAAMIILALQGRDMEVDTPKVVASVLGVGIVLVLAVIIFSYIA